MTIRKMAAFAGGGWVMAPPLDKEKAEEILGQPIPPEAWKEICVAYAAFGRRQRALETSRASRSKDGRQGWHTRQESAVKAIERALDGVNTAKRDGEFLNEASRNYTLQTFGRTMLSEHNARRLLSEAHAKLMHAAAIVERAEAMEVETPTEATSRDMLVRDIHAALVGHGIQARASNGFDLGLKEKVLLKHLTPFEQLIVEMGIGGEKASAAFSTFVRAAIGGEK